MYVKYIMNLPSFFLLFIFSFHMHSREIRYLFSHSKKQQQNFNIGHFLGHH